MNCLLFFGFVAFFAAVNALDGCVRFQNEVAPIAAGTILTLGCEPHVSCVRCREPLLGAAGFAWEPVLLQALCPVEPASASCDWTARQVQLRAVSNAAITSECLSVFYQCHLECSTGWVACTEYPGLLCRECTMSIVANAPTPAPTPAPPTTVKNSNTHQSGAPLPVQPVDKSNDDDDVLANLDALLNQWDTKAVEVEFIVPTPAPIGGGGHSTLLWTDTTEFLYVVGGIGGACLLGMCICLIGAALRTSSRRPRRAGGTELVGRRAGSSSLEPSHPSRRPSRRSRRASCSAASMSSARALSAAGSSSSAYGSVGSSTGAAPSPTSQYSAVGSTECNVYEGHDTPLYAAGNPYAAVGGTGSGYDQVKMPDPGYGHVPGEKAQSTGGIVPEYEPMTLPLH